MMINPKMPWMTKELQEMHQVEAIAVSASICKTHYTQWLICTKLHCNEFDLCCTMAVARWDWDCTAMASQLHCNSWHRNRCTAAAALVPEHWLCRSTMWLLTRALAFSTDASLAPDSVEEKMILGGWRLMMLWKRNCYLLVDLWGRLGITEGNSGNILGGKWWSDVMLELSMQSTSFSARGVHFPLIEFFLTLSIGISTEQSLPSRSATSGRECIGPFGIGPLTMENYKYIQLQFHL